MKKYIPRGAWIILALQQVLYLTPALTMTGVCVSVVLRRRGYSLWGFLIQFIGPAVFALAVLIG